MIVPVKLKPLHEWPADCVACRTEGCETVLAEWQVEEIPRIRVEIDTEKPGIGGPGRSWHVTRESAQRMTSLGFPGVIVSQEDADRLVVCEHMIEREYVN